MPAGSTILSVRRWKTGVFMDAVERYESGDSGICRRLRSSAQQTIRAGRGALLLITGGEETGCDGARALIASETLPGGGRADRR